MTHQIRRKVVLEDIKIPPKNRDAWLKLPLSGDGIMVKAFEENLESIAKMSKEYKASAAQLGYIAAMGPPQKRQHTGNINPSSFHSYRDGGADWSARGRDAFRGRGRSSFRGRGGSSRGSWFSTQMQSTNVPAVGPPARGPQWLSQGECGLQISQSRSDKFQNSKTGGPGRRKGWHFFLPEWASVTSDKWVLDVIRHGYALEFSDMPPRFTGIRRTKMPRQKQHNILLQEVQTLLSKKAIELVPPHKVWDGFYSTLFMVPKNNSEKLRLVINLKPLNQFLLKKSFKMDHLGVVMKLLRKGDWALSVDLTNAYLHVPILSNHRRFLRFAVGHHCYQFRYLSFGPTTAPWVYAECSSAILEGTGSVDHGISGRVSLVSESSRYLCNNRDTTLQVLNRLGFLVNLEKSELLPSQSVKFIVAQFQLNRRFAKIKELIQSNSAQNQISALMLLRILEVMASTIQVIRFSCTLIPVNSGGGGGGGGGSVFRQGCSGLRCWTKQEAQLHINLLESTLIS